MDENLTTDEPKRMSGPEIIEQRMREVAMTAEEKERLHKQSMHEWAIRETMRNEYLTTKEERMRYMYALYAACLWGDKV